MNLTFDAAAFIFSPPHQGNLAEGPLNNSKLTRPVSQNVGTPVMVG